MATSATKQAQKQAEWRKKIAFDHYYNELLNLALSCFEWTNLPDGMDERYIELCLCQEGKIAYFNDDVIGDIVMKFAENGQPDIYNNPTTIQAYSHVAGYNRTLKQDEYVPIYNNYSRTPIIFVLKWYAEKLAELERTAEINIMAQKTPVLLKVDQNSRFSLTNMFKQYEGGTPLIIADRSLDMDGISVLRLDTPFIANDIELVKQFVLNDCLTMLGIDNFNPYKKERLVTNEVVTNLGEINAMRYTRLDTRQEAVEKINKKFGTKIEVNYRQKMPDIMMQSYMQNAVGMGVASEAEEEQMNE